MDSLKALVLIGSLASCSSALAFTGHDLINWSKKFDENPRSEEGAAFGAYVAGVTDAGDGGKFCLPKDFTYQDAMNLSIKHAYAYPVMIPGIASSVIESALSEKYPCQHQ